MEDTEYFKNRFYVFYDYVSKTQGSVFLMEQTKEILERAYEKKDIKQLKGINKELDVWLREMFRPDEKEELSRLLKEKFGEDTKQVDLKRIEKINKIVKRGKINNKNEYELLLQRVEEIYSDDSKNEEVTELNKLLADFHKNK
mgnify:CR=1 FL=1|jgi:hypothetical protein